MTIDMDLDHALWRVPAGLFFSCLVVQVTGLPIAKRDTRRANCTVECRDGRGMISPRLIKLGMKCNRVHITRQDCEEICVLNYTDYHCGTCLPHIFDNSIIDRSALLSVLSVPSESESLAELLVFRRNQW